MNRYDMQEQTCSWPSRFCQCAWCMGNAPASHNFIPRSPPRREYAVGSIMHQPEPTDTRVPRTDRWRCGVLFRWGSVWIGAHYAPNNKRVCINLIPFVTFWITAPGGRVP